MDNGTLLRTFDHSTTRYDDTSDIYKFFGQVASKQVSDAALSPDGTLLASGCADHTVKVWQVADGAPLHTLEGHTGEIHIAFSPDGALLAVGCASDMIKIWRVVDGTLLYIWAHRLDQSGEILIRWYAHSLSQQR